MSKNDKDKMLEAFSEAFHEVVPPLLQDLESRLASKEDLDRIERKLDAQQDRLDRHGKEIGDHERRIHKLETPSL